MPRYIDADALKDELELVDFETDSRMFGGQTVLFEDSVFKIVDSAPTISPDEVRGVARWIPHGDCGVTECSACKWSIEEYVEYNYCPNCGARMSRAEAEKAMEVSEDA